MTENAITMNLFAQVDAEGNLQALFESERINPQLAQDMILSYL